MTGEFITLEMCKKRSNALVNDGNKDFYFMAVKQDVMLDCLMFGNEARFINNSCSPNALVKPQIVNAELKMCVFANASIEIDDEITYEYNWQLLQTLPKELWPVNIRFFSFAIKVRVYFCRLAAAVSPNAMVF